MSRNVSSSVRRMKESRNKLGKNSRQAVLGREGRPAGVWSTVLLAVAHTHAVALDPCLNLELRPAP